MMPGGRMNDRNMRLMMKRMGMTTEEIEGVEEVIIRRAKDELVLESPGVTVITVQGVKTYQIVGEPKTRPRGAAPAPGAPTAGAPGAAAPAAPPAEPPGPPEEDIELVMEQAQVDRPAAIKALEQAHGEPAEAILKILSQRSR